LQGLQDANVGRIQNNIGHFKPQIISIRS